MSELSKTLSVSKAAALCGVGRTTVGYWIRTKKLYARRVGRNYTIPVEDLLYFLESSGQQVPVGLSHQKANRPIFRSFQNCWQHWDGSSHARNCGKCIAFKNQLQACFSARDSGLIRCSECYQCSYYLETIYPRIQFVHQINMPAAVIKNFHLWGGNAHCAELCEVQLRDLIGMAIEKIVHASSLAKIIGAIRKMMLGNLAFENSCRIFVHNSREGRRKIQVSVYPLREPEGVFLVLGMPENLN
jgi:excisionase family DNA binding protein